MLRELFDALVEHAQKALRPAVVAKDYEPKHVYLLATADGRVERREATPEPRNHQAADLETVARWAAAWGASPVSVWYGRAGVVALLDDATRRDRVVLKLGPSPQLLTLRRLEAQQPAYDQKGFVRLLRVELAGCLPSPNLLQAVRTVKFSLLKGLEGEVAHGKESIGKSLKAELTGANLVPETVVVRVPAWDGPLASGQYEVACAVEVDPVGERLQLLPLPGAVEAAVCRAEAALGARLAELLAEGGAGEGVRLSYGAP